MWHDSELPARLTGKHMLGVRFSHFDPRADIEADAEEHRHPPFLNVIFVFTDLQFNSGRAADAPPCGSRRPGLRSGTGPRTRTSPGKRVPDRRQVRLPPLRL